jgi:hypothetical protein
MFRLNRIFLAGIINSLFFTIVLSIAPRLSICAAFLLPLVNTRLRSRYPKQTESSAGDLSTAVRRSRPPLTLLHWDQLPVLQMQLSESQQHQIDGAEEERE